MIAVKEILEKIKFIDYIGKSEGYIAYPISFDAGNIYPDRLMWVNNKNISKLKPKTKGTVICPANTNIPAGAQANYIIVNNPRDTFRIILETFFKEDIPVSISETAKINPACTLGINLFIGENAVIEKNCTIGDNTYIGHNSVLLAGTIIGKNVKIGCNCTIGGVGFGYEKNSEGKYCLIPHLGNVVIQNDVEIGNNTTIDRALMGSTLIRNNVKIDNLVHIAHGVEIGENSLIIANSMIAGSTKIGKNVWIAPSCAILNKLNVKDNAFIGIGAVVIRNVKDNEKIFGNPALPIE